MKLRKATQYCVSKINIDTYSRLVFTAMIKKCFYEDTDHFDPRQYLVSARQELINLVK